MGPKPVDERSDHDRFRTELVNLIDQRHELARLADLIDWSAFAQQWGAQFETTTGRPALPTRLMAALLYLKHVYALSDEDVVDRWVENPYWQHFSGERYFRHELPCDPSSLVRGRKRIGEAGCFERWLKGRTGIPRWWPGSASQPERAGAKRRGYNCATCVMPRSTTPAQSRARSARCRSRPSSKRNCMHIMTTPRRAAASSHTRTRRLGTASSALESSFRRVS